MLIFDNFHEVCQYFWNWLHLQEVRKNKGRIRVIVWLLTPSVLFLYTTKNGHMFVIFFHTFVFHVCIFSYFAFLYAAFLHTFFHVNFFFLYLLQWTFFSGCNMARTFLFVYWKLEGKKAVCYDVGKLYDSRDRDYNGREEWKGSCVSLCAGNESILLGTNIVSVAQCGDRLQVDVGRGFSAAVESGALTAEGSQMGLWNGLVLDQLQRHKDSHYITSLQQWARGNCSSHKYPPNLIIPRFPIVSTHKYWMHCLAQWASLIILSSKNK